MSTDKNPKWLEDIKNFAKTNQATRAGSHAMKLTTWIIDLIVNTCLEIEEDHKARKAGPPNAALVDSIILASISSVLAMTIIKICPTSEDEDRFLEMFLPMITTDIKSCREMHKRRSKS
jgi:hypothetical protein